MLICVVAAMLAVDFILFGCLPLWRTKRAIGQTKSALTVAITKGTIGSGQLSALKQRLDRLQNLLANYEANVPGERALGGFLQQIADLMSKNSLSDQVVAPGEEIRADELNCVPLDVQCKGTIPQIFEFYKRLQALDRLVRIQQVRLENDKDFAGQVDMSTRAVIYYRSQTQPEQRASGVRGKI
jgi:Tfp pilus assembly protein PilO